MYGRDNVMRYFHVEHSSSSTSYGLTYDFYVHKSNPSNIAADDYFQLTVILNNVNMYVVTMMDHRSKKHYAAKGIPEACILYVSQFLKSKIISSSNIKDKLYFSNEYRTDEATKVWRRLEVKGLAKYNIDEDRYYLL